LSAHLGSKTIPGNLAASVMISCRCVILTNYW